MEKNKQNEPEAPPSRGEEQRQERRNLALLLGAVLAGVVVIWIILGIFAR